MSYDYSMMCPNCHNQTRYIVQHISKRKCQKNEDLNKFKEQFKAYEKDYTTEIKKKSIANQRMQNEENVKFSQNKRKRESRAVQRANDKPNSKRPITNKKKKAGQSKELIMRPNSKRPKKEKIK